MIPNFKDRFANLNRILKGHKVILTSKSTGEQVVDTILNIVTIPYTDKVVLKLDKNGEHTMFFDTAERLATDKEVGMCVFTFTLKG